MLAVFAFGFCSGMAVSSFINKNTMAGVIQTCLAIANLVFAFSLKG